MSLISVPPPMDSRIGLYITDGTVTWIVDDVRDGTPVGSIRGSLYLPKGYIKANGATVNRADYPRLVKWINDNNLWTDDTAGNLGLFGKGDGNTTFVLPNYIARSKKYRNIGGQTIAAGLPNIVGYSDIGGFSGKGSIPSGALYTQTINDGYMISMFADASSEIVSLWIDASRGNNVYGASDTVQEAGISEIPIIRY